MTAKKNTKIIYIISGIEFVILMTYSLFVLSLTNNHSGKNTRLLESPETYLALSLIIITSITMIFLTYKNSSKAKKEIELLKKEE